MKNIDHASRINDALFTFLQSVYLFEKRETDLFGVSWSEVYLMQLLMRSPGLSMSEVAKHLHIKMFVASRMVSKLEDGELIMRETSSTDRRGIHLYITPKGMAKVEAIEAYNLKTILEAPRHLDDGELEVILSALEKLPLLLKTETLGENHERTEK